MVNTAASQPVVHSVGTSKLTPADVGSLQPEICIVQLNAKTAERATVFPSRDNGRAEFNITPTASGCCIQVESSCVRDTFVQ